MKTLYVNPLSSAYHPFINEAHSQGYTVVCSQRPIVGLETWELQSIGNGIYYAYGDINEYKDTWEYHAATIVDIQTNEDVLNIIKQTCKENNITLEEMLQDYTLTDMANDLNLCYVE